MRDVVESCKNENIQNESFDRFMKGVARQIKKDTSETNSIADVWYPHQERNVVHLQEDASRHRQKRNRKL